MFVTGQHNITTDFVSLHFKFSFHHLCDMLSFTQSRSTTIPFWNTVYASPSFEEHTKALKPRNFTKRGRPEFFIFEKNYTKHVNMPNDKKNPYFFETSLPNCF